MLPMQSKPVFRTGTISVVPEGIRPQAPVHDCGPFGHWDGEKCVANPGVGGKILRCFLESTGGVIGIGPLWNPIKFAICLAS